MTPAMGRLDWGAEGDVLSVNEGGAGRERGAPSGSGERALVAFYDLSVSPTSFDFATFLARAELARRARDLGALQVVFVPAAGDGFWDREPLSLDSKRERLSRLLVPLCDLLPACAPPLVCRSRAEALPLARAAGDHVFPAGYRVEAPVPDAFQWAHVMAALTCGESLPGWTAPAPARAQVESWLAGRARGRRIVTLTLRESGYYTANNSDLAAWGAFAQQLDRDRYFPVVVRDTECARAELPPELKGVDAFAEAALDVRVRAALYERADLNLTVATGPMLLLWLNPDCASIVFKLPNFENFRSTPVPLRSMGIEPGDPTPLGTPHQRVVWEADTCPNLERGFRELAAVIPGPRSYQEHPLVTARRLRDTGRLDAALRIYAHLQAGEPRNSYVRYARALAELRVPWRPKPLRLWRAGRLLLTAAILPGGRGATSELVEQGLCEERFGLRALAARRYRAVLERDPAHAVALHRLGHLALRRGRLDEAVGLLGAAGRRDPYGAEIAFDLGRALRAGGRENEACEAFRHAERCDPSHVAARRALALGGFGTDSTPSIT